MDKMQLLFQMMVIRASWVSDKDNLVCFGHGDYSTTCDLEKKTYSIIKSIPAIGGVHSFTFEGHGDLHLDREQLLASLAHATLMD